MCYRIETPWAPWTPDGTRPFIWPSLPHSPGLFIGMKRNTRHGESRFMRILRSVALLVLVLVAPMADVELEVARMVATAVGGAAATRSRAHGRVSLGLATVRRLGTHSRRVCVCVRACWQCVC